MATPRSRSAAGERRQLSAFFCDLVGSTELASSFDPEDWWDVLRLYHERVSEIVESHDGHVAQYQGDGLLAYFGYPRTHENAAERAVRAALAALESIAETNDEIERRHGVRLALRIGIHTGRVVVAETGVEGRREVLAMGETVNLASRIQDVAEADQVVISGATEQLIRGRFETDDLGLHDLKGIYRPIRAFRVTAPARIMSPLDLPGRSELTLFVDRTEELAKLLACWESTRAGRGRLAIISGEPGIGKSRLVRVLRNQLDDAPLLWLEAQCSPWMESTAFFPIVELQRRALGVSDRDSPAERLRRFERALTDARMPVAEVLPLLAALHEIPMTTDAEPPPALSREAQRRRTLAALSDWIFTLAESRPVVLLVEDLQWVDPSTSELLAQVLERARDASLLVILTHRADFEPEWQGDATLRLARLADDDAVQLVRAVGDERGVSAEWVGEIASRAGGVPLFLEELARHALDSAGRDPGTDGVDRSLDIPSTLHDSLMARLDQLGPAKGLAQLGAAIGREFSHALLAAAAGLEAADLDQQVAALLASDLLVRTREAPDTSYQFRHALIRDEAYQSLVRASRRELHERIATALETVFAEEAAARPEVVAHHWLEGGDESRGVFYLVMAARRSVRASANVEALRQTDKALAIVEGWPDSPQRTQFELGLQTLKGSALIATRGYASEDVLDAFGRARAIAGTAGDSPQVVPVLHGLWLFHMVRSDRHETAELSEQLRQIGETSEDPTSRMFGLTVAGIQDFFEGRIESSVEYVERAFAIYDPEQHQELAVTYSLGTAGVARSNAAACLWLLGFPDRARDLARRVVEEARRSRHPFTIAGVGVMSSTVFQMSRDYTTVAEYSGEAHRIALEQDFPLWVGGALTGVGQARSVAGDPEEGIAMSRHGQEIFRATGAQTNMVFVTNEIAEMLLASNRLKEAEEAVDDALRLLETNLDRYYAPDVWRMKAEVTWALSGDADEARRHFAHALELARNMKARSLELRAATGLARLEDRAGNRDRAREILAPAYEWFTEGFGTRDLIDARTLLESLESP